MRYHRSLDIRRALALSDAELDKIELTFTQDGEPITGTKAIRAALADELAEGSEYLPYAGCDNFDPQKGCLGHLK